MAGGGASAVGLGARIMRALFGAESRYAQQPLGFASGCAIAVIWATWYIVSRWGVLGNLTAADITLIRYAVGSVLTLPLLLLWRGRRLQAPLRIVALLVVSYGFPYALFLFLGLRDAPAANAGVLLNGLLPIIAAGFAWLFFRQRVSAGKWLAIMILALANGCMLAAGLQDASLALGWLWVLASTVLLAVYLTVLRKWPVDVFMLMPVMSLSNLVMVVPVWLLMPSTLGQASLYEIGLQAFFQGFVNQILVIWLISFTIARIGSVSTTVIYGFVPALTALLGWLALGEGLSWLEIVGVLICTLGIVVYSRSR